MFDQREIRIQQERREDLLRNAERHRLIRQAMAGRETRGSIRCQLLTWLGHRLVTLSPL